MGEMLLALYLLHFWLDLLHSFAGNKDNYKSLDEFEFRPN